MKLLLTLIVLLLVPPAFLHAADNTPLGVFPLPPGFTHITLNVDGLDREAVIYAPPSATSTPAPLVFVFHGHGGSARQVARSYDLFHEWPEAISVYMQGLLTPSPLVDPEGKMAGWQRTLGDQNDRDLKFFDALFAKLKQTYKISEQRIYVTGHSNGGGFTYLLWHTRPNIFAAFAPIAAVTNAVPTLRPKPVLHIAGEQDPIVKFVWQKLTMDALIKVNHCDHEGKPWDTNCTLYPSPSDTPVVTFIHPGGHEIPPGATTAIVKFFKEHPATDR